MKLEDSLCGEHHGMAKLTEKNVLLIRDLYRWGWSTCKLAQQFPVSQYAIWRIVARETWKHI